MKSLPCDEADYWEAPEWERKRVCRTCPELAECRPTILQRREPVIMCESAHGFDAHREDDDG